MRQCCIDFGIPQTVYSDNHFAKTPQAKGRIERLWVTLQSRLPVEFSKRGIRILSEANRFLELEYRDLFDQKFSVTPQAESIFVPVEKYTDLDSILISPQIDI